MFEFLKEGRRLLSMFAVTPAIEQRAPRTWERNVSRNDAPIDAFGPFAIASAICERNCLTCIGA